MCGGGHPKEQGQGRAPGTLGSGDWGHWLLLHSTRQTLVRDAPGPARGLRQEKRVGIALTTEGCWSCHLGLGVCPSERLRLSWGWRPREGPVVRGAPERSVLRGPPPRGSAGGVGARSSAEPGVAAAPAGGGLQGPRRPLPQPGRFEALRLEVGGRLWALPAGPEEGRKEGRAGRAPAEWGQVLGGRLPRAPRPPAAAAAPPSRPRRAPSTLRARGAPPRRLSRWFWKRRAPCAPPAAPSAPRTLGGGRRGAGNRPRAAWPTRQESGSDPAARLLL